MNFTASGTIPSARETKSQRSKVVQVILRSLLWIDRNRERWVASEMMTDIYNHDLYSREVASEAIEKYNRHVERCNRVTEAQETGQPIPGSVTEVSELRTKLQEIADKLGTVSKER